MQNFEKAYKWYKLASQNGLIKSQKMLAFLYHRGWGVDKDIIKAYMWLNISAAQGDLNSKNLRDEIQNEITGETMVAFEPSIDYIVTKIPRFDFEKFPSSDGILGVQMQSVGEVMAIGRTFRDSPEIDNTITFNSKLKIGEFYNAKIMDASHYNLIGGVSNG